MRRTAHIVLLMIAALTATGSARAQQPPSPLIAVVYAAPRTAVVKLDLSFERGLTEQGFYPGRDIQIVYDSAEPTEEGMPHALSQALKRAIARKPAVIVVWSALGARIAKDQNPAIPVVFLAASFPVESGVVPNLRKPGGNITGVATEAAVEAYGKRLELLKEVRSDLQRVALLYAKGDPNSQHAIKAVEKAAAAMNILVQPVSVGTASDLESAFDAIKQSDAHGVVVVGSALTFSLRRRIAELALLNHLPSILHTRESVEAGGLMNFGASLTEIAHQGASYVAKIVRGARPGDLPIEQPRSYELVVNQKTAKALGIKIPESILIRADEVIR